MGRWCRIPNHYQEQGPTRIGRTDDPTGVCLGFENHGLRDDCGYAKLAIAKEHCA